MASTVRAVALAALAKEGKINPSDLERYAPHVNPEPQQRERRKNGLQ